MSFIPGRYYRYRRSLPDATRSQMRVGDIYQFSDQKDFFPTPKMKFILCNAFGEPFDFDCSYEALDRIRLEDVFDEVPKPSWWDQPRQYSGQ